MNCSLCNVYCALMMTQGYYRCNVSNTDKYRISAEAKLSVKSELEEGGRPEAPTFLATPRNTVAIDGSNVTLECAANGHPRPVITWLKDGNTIDLESVIPFPLFFSHSIKINFDFSSFKMNCSEPGSRFHRVASGSLRIDSVVESDVGVYQCRAENAEDSVDVTAQLEVQVPPRYVTRPRSLMAHEKKMLNLNATCMAVNL